jgi:oxygen-independent coproporphyrinogen-3 oxidase
MTRLGIYVQVPFCQTKCTYCNFHTGVVSSARFAPYVDAVCSEIERHRAFYEGAGRRTAAVPWVLKPLQIAGSMSEPFDAQDERTLRPLTAVLPAEEKPIATPFLKDAAVDSVYIGGGTPSLLDPADLRRILEAIWGSFGRDAEPRSTAAASEAGSTAPATLRSSGQAVGCRYDCEVTLEADPETVSVEKAAAWVAGAVNRVSFGVQSFSDEELKATGRMHRKEDVYRAVPILRAAGIANISFDLIAGLPGQTAESWQRSLEELVGLGPEHVSVYLLEVDEGSRLGAEVLRGGVRYGAGLLPTDDLMAEFYETACSFLGAAGYRHYEISNWGKPGFESRHNLKYWRRQPYLGFGAGAHSFSGTERWANAHDAAEYVAAISAGRLPIEQHEVLSAEGALEEELFLGLRQLDGIDLGRIEREYGVAVSPRFDRLVGAGLVELEGCVVRLAAGKLSVSNEVFVELMR